MIPDHIRKNYEATDEKLGRIAMLLRGASSLIQLENRRNEADLLIDLALEAMEEAEKLRYLEWVGLGGKCLDLPPDEIAKARGEELVRPVVAEQ
ncbi:hypothetical protein [Rhodobacteraceae bacterium DSL-40]|uniref:hypothetical protein n=1 Tax=Amaricoccus sp. B4 TaxID=3368557 RepID=UPI000DAEAC08